VMTTHVSGAIRGSAIRGSAAEDAASTVQLANAVSVLGGKFFISAAGVAGSVLAMLVANWQRARVFQVAEHPGAELTSHFTSVEAQQLEHLVALNGRIERLHSIEVSVKALGNEVSANLKHIMKDAMGEQLKDMLATTMVEVADIAERVQKSLADDFGRELAKLSGQLQQSLAALHKAIEGQGQGQLDKILDKLQNTVSGGFQSESQKMVTAFEKFATVIPALEQQLRTMTGKVAEESRQRAQESAQMGQLLMERVAQLIAAMNAQQAANAEAIERMQAASEHGAAAMAQRLEASGAGLVNNVLGASRVEIEAIVEQLRAAAEASARRHGDADAQAQHTAAAIAHASDGLIRGANAVIEVSNQAAQLVTQSRAGSEAIHYAAQQFQHAGQTLLGSVQEMHQVIAAARTQTHEQQQLLMRQQQYTKEVEKLWPELFDTYLAQFKAGADELGRSWVAFHQNIQQLTQAVGGNFSNSTDVLSESVEKLIEQFSQLRRTA
ncbi:MAG: hypothetical protein ACREBE_17325, partial [bacterium]